MKNERHCAVSWEKLVQVGSYAFFQACQIQHNEYYLQNQGTKIYHGIEEKDYPSANFTIDFGAAWSPKGLGSQAEDHCDKCKNRKDRRYPQNISMNEDSNTAWGNNVHQFLVCKLEEKSKKLRKVFDNEPSEWFMRCPLILPMVFHYLFNTLRITAHCQQWPMPFYLI